MFQKRKFKILPIFILILIYVLDIKLLSFFYSLLLLHGLDFWMLEIIFIVFINIFLFKIKIYMHQKVAIAIILILSTLMKILSIISIYESDEEKTFKKYLSLFFIGIIGFIILYFIDGLILCKLKWYFDLKFISEKKMLVYFGLFGFIIFLLSSIIFNSLICPNTDIFNLIYCVYEDESKKYFDNFSIFFKNIWKEDRTPIINIVYIFIFLLKITLSAFHYFFVYLIIKVLSPEYLVCSDSILYFIVKIITLIYQIITGELTYEFIFDFLSQFFSLLGTLIYLELIELNFCNLNHYLKKNINKRTETESFRLLDIYSDDKDEQSSEDNETNSLNN